MKNMNSAQELMLFPGGLIFLTKGPNLIPAVGICVELEVNSTAENILPIFQKLSQTEYSFLVDVQIYFASELEITDCFE